MYMCNNIPNITLQWFLMVSIGKYILSISLA